MSLIRVQGCISLPFLHSAAYTGMHLFATSQLCSVYRDASLYKSHGGEKVNSLLKYIKVSTPVLLQLSSD